MTDLAILSDFVLVASHGGFGAAERATGRPKATLSRQVRELEEALGLRLIDRGGKHFHLIEAGQTLYERCDAPLAEVDEALRALTHDLGAPHGKLRVSCSLMYGHLAMGRVAAEFARR